MVVCSDIEGRYYQRQPPARRHGPSHIIAVMTTTAAGLLIGNELLTGKVQETNLALLARELFVLGVELSRVVVCRDDIDTIASDLRLLSDAHDYVITSGGVGPTHDDVTMKAVARCFGVAIHRSPELAERIRELVGDRCSESHLRMADVPVGSILLQSSEVPWPTVRVANVFVFPGLPKIFRMKLPLLREHIEASAPFHSQAVYTL
jgi:molybdenum cofactor synthesis domain-containing protein